MYSLDSLMYCERPIVSSVTEVMVMISAPLGMIWSAVCRAAPPLSATIARMPFAVSALTVCAREVSSASWSQSIER